MSAFRLASVLCVCALLLCSCESNQVLESTFRSSYEHGDHARVVALCDQVQRAWRTDARLRDLSLKYEGLALFRMGKYPEAYNALKAYIDDGYEDAEAYRVCAASMVYFFKGRLEGRWPGRRNYLNLSEMRKWLDMSLQCDSANAEIHLFRGLDRLALPSGKAGFAKAVSEFDAYLSLTEDAKGHGYRGLSYLRAGYHDEAARDFKKALEYDENSRLYLAMGEALYYSDRDDEALDALEKAVRTPHDPTRQDCYFYPCSDETHDRTYCLMGNIHHNRGDFATAITCYTKGVEASPQFSESRLMRAHAYKTIGEYEKALEDYRFFLDRGMLRPDVISGAAESLYEQGKYEQAVRVHASRKYLHPHPADFPYPRPHYIYGMSYLKQGNTGQAAVHLQKAKRMMEETDMPQRMPRDLRPVTMLTDAELQSTRKALASLGAVGPSPP